VDLHTHTHLFNGPLTGTTRVSRYQEDKTNLDFTAARDSEWQWNPLGHMQVCTSLQTDKLASTPPLFFTGRMPFLPPNQQCQSTEGICGFNPKLTIMCREGTYILLSCCSKKGKGSPYWITEHMVLELIPVLGSQPADDVSHKPGSRLPLLSTRPAVTPATLKRAATSFSSW